MSPRCCIIHNVLAYFPHLFNQTSQCVYLLVYVLSLKQTLVFCVIWVKFHGSGCNLILLIYNYLQPVIVTWLYTANFPYESNMDPDNH
jgi:hypothetical protein